MKTLPELYQSASEALKLYKRQLDKYKETLKDVTEADLNYDSVKSQVTRRLENTATSKTALKDIVSGNDEVLKANETLQKKKANKEAVYETMKYLEMVYTLEKKAMDVLSKEMQTLGG